MTPTEQQLVLDEVTYKDWRFIVVGVPRHDSLYTYMQIQWAASNGFPCNGRKWLLSQHMTKSELVQTAFKAVMTAEEHEAREEFRYSNAAIFGPHFDVDRLVDLCDKETALALRDN